jgi:hypothetical protein
VRNLAWIGLAGAVGLSGGCECYQINPLPEDASIDARVHVDDAYAPPPDAAFSECRDENGAFECGTDACPRELCLSCYPARPGVRFCMEGLEGPEGASVCSLRSGCPDPLLCATAPLATPDSRPSGVCALPQVCRTLRTIDEGLRCHYLDGTAFVTGEIPATPCPEEARGLACGPGCGECDAGFECFGTSEQSGIGHCGLADQSPPRPACGRVGDTTLTCEGGRRCLHFVAPSDVPPFGACLDATTCSRLGELMPERFACE